MMRQLLLPAVLALMTVASFIAFAQEETSVDPIGKPYTSSTTVNLTTAQEAQLKLVTRKVLCGCKTCPPTLLATLPS